MGLDVTAYRKVKKLDVLFNEHGEAVDPSSREPIEDYFIARESEDFPGRAAGLDNMAAYSYEESKSFWSGGYSKYNYWREELAKMAGYPVSETDVYGRKEYLHALSAWNGTITGGPFYELIDFSDCEGTIGPIVSRKLARDFEEWTDRASAIGGSFYEKFMEWRRCFELASDAGAVRFH